MQNSKDLYQYTNIISQCLLIKQKDEAISKATGYNFNIFSILDRERYEVSTHSYFLYELLDSDGSHGQKTKFIELFLTNILGISNYGDIDNVLVERESLTQNNRRLDFTIECENIIVGIEMKIDASDQKNQLFDYHSELKYRVGDKKSTSLYYLTLYGTDASEYSLNGLAKDKVMNLSFEKDIYLWIKMCMESVVSIPILRDALNQYLILIEKLTGKKENVVDEISELLLKEDNLAVAIQMQKSIEKAKTVLQKNFWNLLLDLLPEGFEFVNYDFSKVQIDKKIDNFYRLSTGKRYYGVKKDLLNIEGYTISYYIELHTKPYHGITVSKNGKRSTYSTDELFFPFKNKLQSFSKSSSWWIGWKYFQCEPVDFYIFNESAQSLVSVEKMEKYVTCLVDEINDELDILSDSLLDGMHK